MKFRADRDTLLETLVTASRATSARSGPSFGVAGLRLALRGKQLEVCGSDPDLVIEAQCEVAGESDGSVLVPSRLVVDIVRSFDQGAVAVVAGDEEVRFSSGRAEFVVRVALGAEITRLGVPEQQGIEIPARCSPTVLDRSSVLPWWTTRERLNSQVSSWSRPKVVSGSSRPTRTGSLSGISQA